LPLVVAGGLGITVIVELLRWPTAPRRGISAHAKAALTMTTGIYVIGLLLILCGEWMAGRITLMGETERWWREPLAMASAQAVNARSAGLPIGWLTDLSRPSQWMLSLLMLVGGCPGGAAGGFKLTTLVVLAGGVCAAWRGQAVGRLVAFAAIWLTIYQATAFATFIGLLNTVPEMTADRVLMLAISAVGNVGLTHDTLSIGRSGAYVLSFGMLAGRLLPLLMLWWLATWSARQASPPAVAVG
jgi:trk system potassium uptake protein TrkH